MSASSLREVASSVARHARFETLTTIEARLDRLHKATSALLHEHLAAAGDDPRGPAVAGILGDLLDKVGDALDLARAAVRSW